MSDFIINERTNRKLRIGSAAYKRYMLEQKTKELEEKIKEKEPLTESEESSPVISKKQIKKKTKKVLNDIAKENKKKLEKSNDIEADLRKLLYEKLCNAESFSVRKKFNKKKSKKFYLSSSESESDSSDSE